MPYSLVRIEMAVMDKRAGDKQGERYTGFDFLDRMQAAGPAVVPELAFALESENRSHRDMAGYALGAMLQWDWREAWSFLAERLFRSPSEEEAGPLLAALTEAHRCQVQWPDVGRPVFAEMWARHRGNLAFYAALYLSSDYVVHTVSLNHPDNKTDMRACDYAAYVIQAVSGTDLGAGPFVRSDAVVEKTHG